MNEGVMTVNMVNILLMVVGILLGSGGTLMVIYPKMMRKFGDILVVLKGHEGSIQTLFRVRDEDREAARERFEQQGNLHTETLRLVTKTIDQNTTIIEKVLAQNGIKK